MSNNYLASVILKLKSVKCLARKALDMKTAEAAPSPPERIH